MESYDFENLPDSPIGRKYPNGHFSVLTRHARNHAYACTALLGTDVKEAVTLMLKVRSVEDCGSVRLLHDGP